MSKSSQASLVLCLGNIVFTQKSSSHTNLGPGSFHHVASHHRVLPVRSHHRPKLSTPQNGTLPEAHPWWKFFNLKTRWLSLHLTTPMMLPASPDTSLP